VLGGETSYVGTMTFVAPHAWFRLSFIAAVLLAIACNESVMRTSSSSVMRQSNGILAEVDREPSGWIQST
jgi:hypothetical protein